MKAGVYNMDCMEAMKAFPDKYFDLAVVDPPYGIGFDGGHKPTQGKSGKSNTFNKETVIYKKGFWDNERPSEDYFIELQRVSKNQIIWGGNYFADLLQAKKGWIFWDKKITNANNTNYSDGELAWTSFDCVLRRFTYDWIGFGYLNNPQKEKKLHPTQKPVALYEWIYMNYLQKGGKVLDTHLGSGSNRIAADKQGNIEFYGYEIDKEYFDASVKRFDQYKAQLTMF